MPSSRFKGPGGIGIFSPGFNLPLLCALSWTESCHLSWVSVTGVLGCLQTISPAAELLLIETWDSWGLPSGASLLSLEYSIVKVEVCDHS